MVHQEKVPVVRVTWGMEMDTMDTQLVKYLTELARVKCLKVMVMPQKNTIQLIKQVSRKLVKINTSSLQIS